MSVLALMCATSLAGERPGVRELIQALGQEKWQQREAAAAALIELGEEALPALVRATQHPDAEIRWRARQAMAKLQGPRASFQNRVGRGSYERAAAYERNNPGDKAGIARRYGAVARMFTGTEWGVKAGVRSLDLGIDIVQDELEPHGEGLEAGAVRFKSLDEAVAGLASDKWPVRRDATRVLLSAGTVVRPLVEKALANPDPEVQRRARRVLAHYQGSGDEAPMDPPRAGIQLPDGVRSILGVPKPKTASLADHVRALIQKLGGLDEDASENARRDLVEIGEPALQFLIEALSNEDENVRIAVMDILGDVTGRKFGFDVQRWLEWWKTWHKK